MELVRYDPWLRLSRPDWLLRFLEPDWMEPFLGEAETGTVTGFVPAVDIREKDDAYVVEAEIPGLKKEEITIDLGDGVLTLSGERKFERDEKKDGYSRVERCYGTFRRSFTIPEHVLTDKIDASYKDGILTVTLPKGEVAKPKQIDIKIQ